jgi:3-hydroxy-3-methylglutaryl CoA synthase
MSNMIGITAWGTYIPRARLSKQAMADANTWFDAGLKSLAKGERSVCNWDEDSITMAVEAGQDCLSALHDKAVTSLYLASSSLPFPDRQNSVVVTEALNLEKHVRTMDISASQRAATSALIALLESNSTGNAMLVAAEHRRTKAGSRAEMLWGDASAAVTVGSSAVVAEYLGAETLAVDFVDHYRGQDSAFDYDWEERWVRDEGYMKSVPVAVNRLLKNTSTSASDIKHFILPTDQVRTPGIVAKKLGIDRAAIGDNLLTICGVAGVAQPLLLLAGALESSSPGDLILLLGFGQGCDAMLFRATENVGKNKPALGLAGALARRREEHNYNKFLSFNNLVERELGKRSEADKQTFLSAYNRRKDLLTGFIGGKCRECGTVQIPREKYCVNPECNALESQDDTVFSGKKGTVKTWTADHLTFDWSPPAYFGMVEFDGGGKLMMDFTEVEEGSLDFGSKVSMHFRIKQFDTQRGFRKYFWKASPLDE